MRNQRLRLAHVTLLVVSTALAVLMLEAALRVTGHHHPLMWEPDPELGWRHIPGSRQHWREEGDGWVEINSAGMRDPERSVVKAPGVFRIAVFGDSMTEAIQVNLSETFTQRLEAQLRQRGVRVEVLNFGVNGYGPLQEYLQYKCVGRLYAPDLVLHAVFLDNDIADGEPSLAVGQTDAPFLTDSANQQLEIDLSRAEASFRDYQREPIYTVRRFSAVYRAVGAARRRLRQAEPFRAGADDTHVPTRYQLYAFPMAPAWQKAWNAFERVISAFASSVNSDGAKYAILSVPAGQVVHEDAWQRVISGHPAMLHREWRLLDPESRLRDLAEKHQIPLIAPLHTFRKNSHAGPLFFGAVGHMTPRGHEVMAAALLEALTAGQLLGDTSPSSSLRH